MIYYTREEILEAKNIIGKITASLPSYMWFRFEKMKCNNYDTLVVLNQDTEIFNKFDGIIPDTHKYNDSVSRAVALCKFFNKEMPKWLGEQ